MTGTANVMYDYHENTGSALTNIDLLSAWLFGKINADCTLLELNSYGASILVSRSQRVPAETFKLIIMSPQNSEQVHTIINATQQGMDHEYSETHLKVTVRFENPEPALLQEINILQAEINRMATQKIKCSLLKQ